MTKLNGKDAKPVIRQCVLITDHREKPRPQDHVVVALYPNQTIGFRQVRGKTEYVVPLAEVYKFAVRMWVVTKPSAVSGQRSVRKKGGEDV